MTAKRAINFKDHQTIVHLLDTALSNEEEKLERSPIPGDLDAETQRALAWGYVVTGYFLLEEFFKAILHLRNQPVKRGHSLKVLFDDFEPNDQELLRGCYSDYNQSTPKFPFADLDDFLGNLDGVSTQKAAQGGIYWRYCLIEEVQIQDAPIVSVTHIHEIARGCKELAWSILVAIEEEETKGGCAT